jgi:hypothetical protein
MLFGLLVPATARAQEPPTLRPGERIAFPGVTLTVLGLSVQRNASSTLVALNMRAQTDEVTFATLEAEHFRILAAGVPRAPEWFAERIPRDAAKDHRVSFTLQDRTDDLVLRIRMNGVTELRRLPAS